MTFNFEYAQGSYNETYITPLILSIKNQLV